MNFWDRCAVVVPYYGAYNFDHAECIGNLTQLSKRGILSVRDVACIDQARSFLASRVLQEYPQVEALLWIDSDILFLAQDAEALLRQCLDGHPFVAASYSGRRAGTMLVNEPAAQEAWYGPEQGATLEMRPGSIGFGFVAVHRQVFEAVGQSLEPCTFSAIGNYPGLPYFHPRLLRGEYLGEDTSFCSRAVDAGFVPEVDTRIRLFHAGQHWFDIEDTRAQSRSQNLLVTRGSK